MIKESTIYGGLYWNIVKVRGIILVENELGTVASILFLELIKKEGEEAAKKKKEILAERITPLPTLNGMSKFLELRFSIESGLNNSNSFWIIQFNSLNHVVASDQISYFQVMMNWEICAGKFTQNATRSMKKDMTWKPRSPNSILKLKISKSKSWISAEVSSRLHSRLWYP